MSIDEKNVQHIAKLARIAKPEGQDLANLVTDLNNIIAWVEQLGELNTDDVPPMTSAVASKLPARQDVVSDGGYAEDIVKNATEAADNFFVVPQVVE